MTTALAEIDAPDELRQHVAACVKWSTDNAIATPEQFQATATHLQEIKAAQKKADAFFDPPIKQAYDLHRMLVARKKVLTEPLTQSERIDKAKMLTFQQEEQAKAEAERRRLQAIADEAARKEREKIEQAAAKQRAIEAEARAKAEAARREAEQASAAERKRLIAEAEAAERKAAAALAKQEAAEEKSAAVVAPVIAVASAAPTAKGISTRKVWTAEIVDLEKFLAFAVEHKRHDLILPNEKVLDALAKGLKSAASIPGVKFSEVSSVSARCA